MTLFGDRDLLASFSSSQVIPMTSLPICQGQSFATSVQSWLSSSLRPTSSSSPIDIQLVRRIAVNSRASTGRSVTEEKSYMAYTKPVGQGAIHTIERGPNYVTFSGTFTVPSSVGHTGFTTNGIQVMVSIPSSLYFGLFSLSTSYTFHLSLGYNCTFDRTSRNLPFSFPPFL